MLIIIISDNKIMICHPWNAQRTWAGLLNELKYSQYLKGGKMA